MVKCNIMQLICYLDLWRLIRHASPNVIMCYDNLIKVNYEKTSLVQMF